MKKLKIYLDTSVIGGSFDDGFKDHSMRLIKVYCGKRLIWLIKRKR